MSGQTPPPTPTPSPYAVPPGSAPPGPPVATPGGNFRSGKQKTILLIVGAVVGIGVLGGLAAAVLGGDDGDRSPVAVPVTQNSGILNPTPVGNASPAPDPGATPPPDTGEATVTPTPTPTPEPAPEPAGDTVTIGDGVQVFVPDGWSVLGDPGETSVNLADDRSSWVFALTGTVGTTADAASVLQASLESFLPSDYYSQLETSDITELDPFGSVVSGAVMEYEGMWVDAQGSSSVHGRIYAAVRQDGTALLLSVEHAPPDGFDASADSWGPLVDTTFNAFGSL